MIEIDWGLVSTSPDNTNFRVKNTGGYTSTTSNLQTSRDRYIQQLSVNIMNGNPDKKKLKMSNKKLRSMAAKANAARANHIESYSRAHMGDAPDYERMIFSRQIKPPKSKSHRGIYG